MSIYCLELSSELTRMNNSDICDTQTELITSKGYPCEDHTVTTADGFILSLQRIPYGKRSLEKPASRPVVFLQHGLLDSSATWVMNLANESLGMCCSLCKLF